MKNRNLISSLLVLLTPIFLYGQSVVGVVTDDEGQPLVGANVVVVGTSQGGVADNAGKYTIDVGASGDYGVTASYIGYSSVTNTVKVNDIVGTVNFLLEVDAVTLSALEVLASRADETTPVAYTTVDKEEMEFRLGSQDIPIPIEGLSNVTSATPINITTTAGTAVTNAYQNGDSNDINDLRTVKFI